MNEFGVTYGNLRGTNYLFNSSLQLQRDFSLFSAPTDGGGERRGTYSKRNVESELAALAAAGFNNLRIWLPFFGWFIDREQFRANLEDFLARCRAHRLTLTWVVWDGIGNGILWESNDLIQLAKGNSGDPPNEDFYTQLETLTQVFQQRHGQWVPPDKPWHLTGYPSPGNKLLGTAGDPETWPDPRMRDCAHAYVDELISVLQTDDGAATLFQIDLANELDGVGIPLPNIVDFLDWNYRKFKRAIPDAPTTVGWAFHDQPRYESYVLAIRERGIHLTRDSFHIYVQQPRDYEMNLRPLLDWAARESVELMVTEFYRTDTPEWGRLQEGLEFFEREGIPTIMWGYINSNIYDDPNKTGNQGNPHLDGVVSSQNLEFNEEYRFEPLNDADHRAVLDYNQRVSPP